MLFGVDGTGVFRDETYQHDMADSFVRKICNLSGGMYWRGPDSIDTFLSGPNPRIVAEAIRMSVVPDAAAPVFVPGGIVGTISYPTSSRMLTNLKSPVFLTGYSRGAATVLDVAVILKEYGIPVEGLFLFDAVTRSPWLSANVIPSNVSYSYHAKRNPTTKSRKSFGNSAAKPEVPGENHLSCDDFLTTHAGMGGTPWGPKGLIKPIPRDRTSLDGWLRTPSQVAANMVAENPQKYADKIYEGAPDWEFTEVTVAEEKKWMDQVRDWMWPHLRKHGLQII